ncbi:MAG: putative type secretion system protein [Pseudomonadota bacterium]|jgi:type IV pilus assembly protein PilB
MERPTSETQRTAVDAPVVHYLQQAWEMASQLRASDLHFEPFENFYRVRLRVDGVLQEIAPPPYEFKDQIASRIKVLAKLDIAEKRLPQDGRMTVGLRNLQRLNLRVSTLPTLYGEKLVVRVLATDITQLHLDHLGYGPQEKQRMLEAIHKTQGLILVTGPTGSGKSQSLYACLHLLNRPEINIATVEDPAEIQLSGVNQVNVKEQIGLNFSSSLKAFLRQDPDVLMVGEIRDPETADIAIKASQTGHLVLSTLHTNDAPGAIVRLRNMGVAAYNLAASISLISAQRLIRRLCLHCRQPMHVSHQALIELGFQTLPQDLSFEPVFYSAQGCPQCHKGYWGRVGLFEVMPMSASLRQLVLTDASHTQLSTQAQKEGVHSLRHAGLMQAAMGITSMAEALSQTECMT